MEEVEEKSFEDYGQELLSALGEADTPYKKRKVIEDYIAEVVQLDLAAVTEFPPSSEWFNTSRALSLAEDLRGKIVVLDFFTYCCINCMHILPDLHALEQKHSMEDGVVVVGVHSAKFDNEKLSANILSAVLRYDIAHPVLNDSDSVMWHGMNIRCWPTLVVLSPDHKVLLELVGEGHREALLAFVDAAVEYYESLGQIRHGAVDWLSPSRESLPSTPLLFPGKVAVNDEGLLAISDSGHHRIIITDRHGVVQETIGCGTAGHEDGTFHSAKFRAPQGVCWLGNDTVFVADTENHVIRKIVLGAQKRVETVCGQAGVQGHDLEGGQSGTRQLISSPWDVALGSSIGSLDQDVLFIAMAGTHQIWMYFLKAGNWLKGKSYAAGVCVRFAGSGQEENRNNNYPHNAAFAQPSGICLARLSSPASAPPPALVLAAPAPVPVPALASGPTPELGLTSAPPPPPSALAPPPPPPALAPPPPPPPALVHAPPPPLLTPGLAPAPAPPPPAPTSAPPPPPALAPPPPPPNFPTAPPPPSSHAPTPAPYSHLLVADAESSSVRSVSLRDGAVKNVAGGEKDPQNLFAFGDVDGKGTAAKFQHPLAVCYVSSSEGNLLYVADSYNHKIKRIDLETMESVSVFGTGTAGSGTSQLNEPGGLCVHAARDGTRDGGRDGTKDGTRDGGRDGTGTRLYIADTNNHVIKVAELNNHTGTGADMAGMSLREFPILFPAAPLDETDSPRSLFSPEKRITGRAAEVLTPPPLRLVPGQEGAVEVVLGFRDRGLHLTEGVDSVCKIRAIDEPSSRLLQATAPTKVTLSTLPQPVHFPLTLPPRASGDGREGGEYVVEVECLVYYCDEGGACRMKGLRFVLPVVESSGAGGGKCKLEYTIGRD